MFSFGEQLSIILFELCVTVFDYSLQYWSEPPLCVHNPHLKFELCVNPTFVSYSLKFPLCLYPSIVHIGLVHIEYIMFTPDNLSRDKMKNYLQVCFPRTFKTTHKSGTT